MQLTIMIPRQELGSQLRHLLKTVLFKLLQSPFKALLIKQIVQKKQQKWPQYEGQQFKYSSNIHNYPLINFTV